ncbi:hypothetical protein L2E82_27347 [Cichorium intybus]|uniref:Uncharacterized protein n=1 Tax=Cichorium intybus TaxID=13427 RepID=A0ACB9CSQ8_CICIN|nr:hypothetical protein L2E82_27347 [Cichorium intybus]
MTESGRFASDNQAAAVGGLNRLLDQYLLLTQSGSFDFAAIQVPISDDSFGLDLTWDSSGFDDSVEAKRGRFDCQSIPEGNVPLSTTIALCYSSLEPPAKILAFVHSTTTERQELSAGLEKKRERVPIRTLTKGLHTETIPSAGAGKDQLGLLSGQLQSLTKDASRLKAENEQVVAIKSDIDGMRKDLVDMRIDYEMVKKANEEHMIQKESMEKNLISMAREIEKLRGEQMRTRCFGT